MSNLEEVFSKFAKAASEGKSLSLEVINSWLKQAGLKDEKKITSKHIDACFKKFKSQNINFQQFQQFIKDLAKTTNSNVDEMTRKLAECNTLPPSLDAAEGLVKDILGTK